MPHKNLLFRNAQIWNPDEILINKDVYVRDGVIEKIEDGALRSVMVSDYEVIELNNEVLMPAGVDLQVHLRIPGQEHKEKPETGLRAALQGGYGAVLNMPNTKPVIDSPEVLKMGQERVAEIEAKSGITVLWTSAVTKGQAGLELVDFEAMKKAGVVAFTEDGVGIKQEDHLRAVLAFSAQSGIPVLEHAENYGHGGAMGAGPVQEKLNVPLYKREAEWLFVERDLKILADFPEARYHVLHVSTRETVGLIEKAKLHGLRATAEVSPHHLYFCTDDIPEGNTSFKMNPPIQQETDRMVLQNALFGGLLDYVATDHAPHEKEVKSLDLAHCAYGTTGLESALRVLIDFYQKGALSPERLVQVFSTAPAHFIGLEAEYGLLAEGRPFRAVWLDPEAPAREFSTKDLYSLSSNNVFLGAKLGGQIKGHGTKSGFFRF